MELERFDVPGETLTIRVLQGEDVLLASGIFESNGWVPPSPSNCRVVVAESATAGIIAVCSIQIIPHLEPIWVDTSYRGTGLADKMVKNAAKQLCDLGITRWLSIIRNDQSKRLAIGLGMNPIPGEVYLR